MKIKFQVLERVDTVNEFIIELPDGVDDKSIWDEIDESFGERDIYSIIENAGGSILKFIRDDSPYVELEVLESDEIIEEGEE